MMVESARSGKKRSQQVSPLHLPPRRARALAEAWQVAAELIATPELDQQLGLVLRCALGGGGGDTATIFLRDAASGVTYALARQGYEIDSFGPPRSGGLTDYVLSTGHQVVVDDTLADPRINPVVVQNGIRSLVALPLQVSRPGQPVDASPVAGDAGRQRTALHRQTVGVLFVNAKRVRAFDPAGIDALKGLAALAAVAIENRRLLELQQATSERLVEALRQRDQFVSAASHELKGPLTPLKGYAQALQKRFEHAAAGEQPLDYTWMTRALQIIVSQVDRLDRLVIDLLHVNQLRAGKLPLILAPCDLVALARETFERFRDGQVLTERAAGRRHELVFAAAADSLPGIWDGDRLAQLMINLLDNAVKYSPNGGSVELWVEPGEDVSPLPPVPPIDRAGGAGPGLQPGPGWAHLAVRDQGIGLPPGEAGHPHIFTPFTRESNAVVSEISGFGLGLYVCAEIVHRHGGAIWADSPGEGEGTTVHVLLPPAPAETPAETPDGTLGAVPAAGGAA